MSGKRKGARRERQLRDLYERAGYETFSPQESKYGETDIFGEFDVLALGPEPEPVHLVQVKANQPASIRAWCEPALEYARDGVRVRLAVCYDREGWRFIDPVPGGHQTVLDERDQDVPLGEGVVEFLHGGESNGE